MSQWERGQSAPPADSYIRLGSLAGDPLCWVFWGRAGLSTAEVMRVLLGAHLRLSEGRIASVQIVHAGAQRKQPSEKEAFVAIQLHPARCATLGDEGGAADGHTH